jgi:8-hydroxy-5-deazaflavin:NADPH oxidoreductase
MRIAVIGTGMVGQALAGRLDELGHDVTVGTRDVDASLARTEGTGSDGAPFGSWASAHPGVVVAAFAEAAVDAEVVVNAVSGDVCLAALEQVGAARLDGAILMDLSNPLDFSRGFPPTLFVKDSDSLGEQIQAAFPGARVVKTLNTLTAELMVRPAQLAGAQHSVFVGGNDPAAKAVVSELLTSMGHTDVLDLGDITSSRGTEMFLPLWLRIMQFTGTAMFNVKVVRDAST